MIDVEYIESGNRVIIPVELWEALEKLAEHVQVYQLARERKGLACVDSPDDIAADEGLSRADR